MTVKTESLCATLCIQLSGLLRPLRVGERHIFSFRGSDVRASDIILSNLGILASCYYIGGMASSLVAMASNLVASCY